MQTIRLTKAWGRYKAGTELGVLGPDDPVQERTVDAARAEQLLRSKLAAKVEPAPPADAAAKVEKATGEG